MAGQIILADTSILIDFFRKTDKSNSHLIALVRQDYIFCISAITEYEIYTGATESQIHYWQEFLKKTQVLAFDKDVVKVAVRVSKELKRKRKQIGIADLFIAATAIDNNMPLATLNRKHFDRIENLQII